MNAAKPKLVTIPKNRASAKPKTKGGASKMREAADEVVGGDCKPLVEALANNGKKGQMKSAKLLYDLAKAAAEDLGEGDGVRKFRSMALEIANSPEWTGEPAPDQPDEDDDGDEN